MIKTYKGNPDRTKACPYEDEDLINFMLWLDYNHNEYFKACFHVANESKSAPQYRAKLRKKGMKKGVPDLILPIPHGEFSGICFELKRNSGAARVSPEQKQFAGIFSKANFMFCYTYGLDEIKKAFNEYLQLG